MNKATKTLELTGDSEANETVLYVFTPGSVCSVSWNGKKLAITATSIGLLKASFDAPGSYILPSLGPWKSHDSLPEISATYNASSAAWIGKSLMSTPDSALSMANTDSCHQKQTIGPHLTQ